MALRSFTRSHLAVAAALLILSMTSCLMPGLFGPQQHRQIPVVAATETPPIDAGHGWYCNDVRVRTEERNDPQVHLTTRDYCVRTIEECQAKANRLIALSDAETIYSPGSCSAQSTATCSYRWGSGYDRFFCTRSPSSCNEQSQSPGNEVNKQSQCTDYP